MYHLQSTPALSFNLIPPEAKTHIFSYLSPIDLACCQKVCKLWKEAIQMRVNQVKLEFPYFRCLQNLEIMANINNRLKEIEAELHIFSEVSFSSFAFQRPNKSITTALHSKDSSLYGGTNRGKIIIWDQQTKQIVKKIQTAIKTPIKLIKIQNDQIWIMQEHLSVLSLEGKLIRELRYNSTQGEILDIQSQRIIQLLPSKLTIYQLEDEKTEEIKIGSLEPSDEKDPHIALVRLKANHLFALSQEHLICWNLETKKISFRWDIKKIYDSPLQQGRQIGRLVGIFQLIIKHHIAIIHLKGHPLIASQIGKGIKNYGIDHQSINSFFYAINLRTGDIKYLADIEAEIHENCIFKNNKLIYSHLLSSDVKAINYVSPNGNPPTSDSVSDANSGTLAKLAQKLSFRKGK